MAVIYGKKYVFYIEEHNSVYELNSIPARLRECSLKTGKRYEAELEDMQIVSHNGKLVTLLKYRIV